MIEKSMDFQGLVFCASAV